MSKIAQNLLQLVGSTPLVALNRLKEIEGLKANIIAKVEYFNPAGSIKDRIALAMIEEAEASGRLKPGATIIEPTSGNTGVGLAMVASIKGYKLILTMPETMSIERRRLLAARGATLELTPGSAGMSGAIARAQELNQSIEGSIILQQFENGANPKAHEGSTALEILRDTDGQVDIFVAGVGTGGTISGSGRVLKEHNKDIQVVAVEPSASPVLSGGKAGPHKIQGIGAGFIPKNYDGSVVDLVVPVTNEDAMTTARNISKYEGLLVGISSGAALKAAIDLASKEENAGKNIVVILPDTGERYLTTELFNFDA